MSSRELQQVSLKSVVYSDAPFRRGTRTINMTQVNVEESDKKNDFDTVIVIDRSGSMSESMYYVKATLKSVYDQVYKVNGSLTVITFNNKAEVVYSSTYTERNSEVLDIPNFDEQKKFMGVVDKISSTGTTNIQEALRLALESLIPNRRSLVCLVSDGQPNEGSTSPVYFKDLISTLPSYCLVNTIGFGQGYSESILKAIGQLTHIDDIEKISGVIGSMIGVIESMFGFNAVIETSGDSSNIALGEPNMGLVYYGRKYYYATHLTTEQVDELVGSSVKFSYTTMEGKNVELSAKVELEKFTPTDIKEKYYKYQAIKIIERLDKTLDKESIIKRVNSWPKEGEKARELILNAILLGVNTKMQASLQDSARTQISYYTEYDFLEQSTQRQDEYTKMSDVYASSYLSGSE